VVGGSNPPGCAMNDRPRFFVYGATAEEWTRRYGPYCMVRDPKYGDLFTGIEPTEPKRVRGARSSSRGTKLLRLRPR